MSPTGGKTNAPPPVPAQGPPGRLMENTGCGGSARALEKGPGGKLAVPGITQGPKIRPYARFLPPTTQLRMLPVHSGCTGSSKVRASTLDTSRRQEAEPDLPIRLSQRLPNPTFAMWFRGVCVVHSAFRSSRLLNSTQRALLSAYVLGSAIL